MRRREMLFRVQGGARLRPPRSSSSSASTTYAARIDSYPKARGRLRWLVPSLPDYGVNMVRAVYPGPMSPSRSRRRGFEASGTTHEVHDEGALNRCDPHGATTMRSPGRPWEDNVLPVPA